MAVSTPLLDQVSLPSDLKKLSKDQLRPLSDELRAEVIDAASETGGHFGAGLGVVELTVALHHVFNTPEDKIIWDVSHQAYPHKILTGRRDRIRSIRQKDGLYGFTKRAESNYDPFGAAHSSTSISSALGFARSRDHQNKDYDVIAVIGDGAASAGMAYEGLNNAGSLGSKMLVVLNDNGMSIAPAIGGLTNYLKSVQATQPKKAAADAAQVIMDAQPKARPGGDVRSAQDLVSGTMFDQLGLTYVGPVDGHDVEGLAAILTAFRDAPDCGPVVLHIITEKGYGHPFALPNSENYHAVKTFCPETFEMDKGKPSAPSYTSVFAKALIKEAEQDARIVAVTAGMPSGTGINTFEKAFPDRTYDVAIAEQHAVTFAAGMAADGMKPFAAIYSTFLQRAYDQVVHDVALQNLPVRFAIDRAGLVGQDGATHAGSFDIAYLGCLPNMVIMASGDEAELMHMTRTAAAYDEGPIAFRFPRGAGTGIDLPEIGDVLTIGKGRVLREGSDVALLSFGGRLADALMAADQLADRGVSVTVADARFAKPIDTDLIERLSRNHALLLTIEEGSIGGFASQVMAHLASQGLLEEGAKVRPMTLPDRFIAHGKPEEQYLDAGLTSGDIVRTALQGLNGRAAHLKAIDGRG